MSSNSEIFNPDQKHLVGKIIFSDVPYGKILDIEMPCVEGIVTVTSADFPTKKIKILNEFVPVLAQNYIEYLGQPVMAVFGDEEEDVDRFIAQTVIKTDYQASENNLIVEDQDPFVYTSGEISQYFTEGSEIIASDFCVEKHSSTMMTMQRFWANFVNGDIYLKMPTQWPLHVRDSVAIALNVSKKSVQLELVPFRTNFDQLVLLPSVVECVAAIAAIKAGCPVSLMSPLISWQPGLNFHIETQLDDQSKPLAFRANVDVDMGAYCLFADEMCNQILAGLIPSYDFKACKVTIKRNRSNTNPANFFGDLGHGMAVAASEHHMDYMLHKKHIMPSAWRQQNLMTITSSGARVIKSSDPEAISLLIEDAAQVANFDRNHSVYVQNSIRNRLGRSIMSYSRGIALCSGQGIFGFSNKFPLVMQYSTTVELRQDKKIHIKVGLLMDKHLKSLFKSIVQKYFSIDEDDIIFDSINDPQVKDLGPNTLSRTMGLIPSLLESACSVVRDKQLKNYPLPIVEESYYLDYKNAPYFESHCCATIIIDLHIDTVRIIPVIDHITARLKFGKVYDTVALTNSIRHIISQTISEICPCAENISDVDLKVRSNPKLGIGSCSSVLRGITAASLTSALSQAISYNIKKIPINDTDLMQILTKQGEQHEAELHN